MRVNRSFRYELKPNNCQKGLLTRCCGVARFAWNWGLFRRKELYRTEIGDYRFTNAIAQHRELNVLKKGKFSWMYEVSKCVPQESLRDLDRAYANFRRGLKTHENVGLPKFKNKGVHDSFRLTGHIRIINDKYIKFPKIGRIRTKESTKKLVGKILSVTVSHEVDRWYCSLCVEVDRNEMKPSTNEIVGIDLGIIDFAVVFNGEEYSHEKSPRPLKSKLKKLKRLSKQQSRKKLGSNNRKKANLRLARLHRRVKNIRKDYVNKLTTELTKTKSVIVIEDLQVKKMMGKKNHKRHLSRSISDAGWGEFRRQMEYKSIWYGSRLIKTPKSYPSSKMCSVCGYIKLDLTLSDRTWICPECGTEHQRDENSSTNMRNYGLRILSTESCSESYACGEIIRPDSEASFVEAGSERIQ
jgi:putative transposase